MMQAFDHTARYYDQEFSWSPIGLIQRKQVWNFLESKLRSGSPLKILELNCGTGEDAIWFAKHNHNILATDISMEMVRIARQKAFSQGQTMQVHFRVMDIRDAKKCLQGEKFDLVFSNFGGFNCLSTKQLAAWLNGQLPALLNPNGRFVAVLMSKFCAWESLYFLSRLQFGKAFRRRSKESVEGKLGGAASVDTWYFSPGWIKRNLPGGLSLTAVRPIGAFIPPSYLNSYFSTRASLLQKLQKLETKVENMRGAAFFSDHFLVEIQWNTL